MPDFVHGHLVLVAILLCASLVAGSSRVTLGISPQDEGYYSSNVIRCRDGSKKITRDQLNDDFCDCPDGTDEPGTSACPEGRFYCRNTGHIPITIYSSRVNDGICDCCDGSDEYDGMMNCTNTCWEAGKVARERLKKKITTYEEGVTIRRQAIRKAKDAYAKDEAELSNLKKEEKILKGLVQKLKDKKELIEKAEEQERLKMEEEQKQKEQEKKSTDHEKQSEGPSEIDVKDIKSEAPDSVNQDAMEASDSSVAEDGGSSDAGHVSTTGHDVNQEKKDSSAEGLSKEELGRLVASRWTGENVDHKTDEDTTKEVEHKDDSDPPEGEGEDYGGYISENDEDSNKYGDDDDDFQDSSTHDEYRRDTYKPNDDYDPESEGKEESPEYTASTGSTWLERIQHTAQNILQKVNIFKSPVNTSEAAYVKKEYEDSNSRLSKARSRISSLTQKLKHDFGVDKEFFSFYDHCFEIKQNKYVYKICPFKQASQIEGYSTTTLGHWEKFEESYKVLLFLNGDKCWNGPDRSLKVRLRCGLKNELVEIDEPSRCEYLAFLSTPVVCLEEKLKELKGKLEMMNSGQPLMHDEL